MKLATGSRGHLVLAGGVRGHSSDSDMFEDPRRYPFLKRLVEHTREIRKEFESACQIDATLAGLISEQKAMDRRSDVWAIENGINIDAVGYDLRDGGYSMVALKTHEGANEQIDVERLFPLAMNLLDGVPGLQYACFAVLKPRARLGVHVHSRSHYIYHVLLNDLQGGVCEISCGDEIRAMQNSGDEVLFDYSLPHGTLNRSDQNRINLMIDFKL
jgi:hypothetical protein